MNKKLFGTLLLLGFALNASAGQPQPLTSQVKNDENEVLLADSFSRTLYIFDLDNGQATSACNGACAELWPPYLISADEVTGLVAPFGSLKRTSQKIQLTYQNHPLYTYAPDRKVGDDQGDDVGNVWHYIKVGQ
jgi:predicted lipoprotein with Yx(FWY)xxD motif